MGTPAPWRLHDLRRTFVTGLADLGIRPDVLEMAVNHACGLRGGVAGVYNKSELLPQAARGVGALGGARRRPRGWEGIEGGAQWCKSDGSATYTAKGWRASRGDR
jgi:hypothetical protein